MEGTNPHASFEDMDNVHELSLRNGNSMLNSLDALERMQTTATGDVGDGDEHAASVALPGSHAGSLLRDNNPTEPPNSIHSPEILENFRSHPSLDSGLSDSQLPDLSTELFQDFDWRNSIFLRLERFMPHLKNFSRDPMIHERADITCFDYYVDDPVSTYVHSFGRDHRAATSLFREKIMETIPSGLRLRFLVIEDLSPSLINIVGSCLGASPEFFEEHLTNSGWQSGLYADSDPATWNTRNVTKDYASIVWCRPTERGHGRHFSLEQHMNLLNISKPPVKWSEKVESPIPQQLKHFARSVVNILRHPWRNRFSGGNLGVGWVERATIWKVQLDHCEIVVLLVDPLPMIRRETTSLALEIPQPRRESVSDGMIRTNASRASDETDPAARDTQVSRDELSQNAESLTRRSSSDLELTTLNQGSLATSNQRDTSLPQADDLNDRDLEAEHHSKRRKRSLKHSLVAFFKTRYQKVHDSLLACLEARKDTSRQRQVEQRLGTTDECLFHAPVPRLPLANYTQIMSAVDEADLAIHMEPSQSSLSILKHAISSGQGQVSCTPTPIDILEEIVFHDTMNLLQSLRLNMTTMDSHSLNESTLQNEVDEWRHHLKGLDIELRHVEDSIRSFAQYMTPFKAGSPFFAERGTHGGSDQTLFQRCEPRICDIQKRIKDMNKSLMMNMSLVESKRGIAEAESVTKLTELAFFFIPLTFSASVFSMQVKELSAGQLSLAAFFILALVVTTCSYAVRLVIRSTRVREWVSFRKSEIKRWANLPSNAPIPTSAFLLWFCTIAFPIALPLVTGGFFTAIFAGLWTRHLESGLQAGFSTAFGMVILFGAIMIFSVRKGNFVNAKWARKLVRTRR